MSVNCDECCRRHFCKEAVKAGIVDCDRFELDEDVGEEIDEEEEDPWQ